MQSLPDEINVRVHTSLKIIAEQSSLHIQTVINNPCVYRRLLPVLM